MGSGVGVTSTIEDFALKYAFLSFGDFFLLVRQIWVAFFEDIDLNLVPTDRVATGQEFIVEFFLLSSFDVEQLEFFGRNLWIFYDF